MKETCLTCQYHDADENAYPCNECEVYGSNSNYEKIDCKQCVYNVGSVASYPCVDCIGNDFGNVGEKNGNYFYAIENTDEKPTLTHEMVCNWLTEIYKQKNAAYGDSFHELYKKLGITSCVTQIAHKNNRLCNLVKNPTVDTKGETVKDTLLDMANYCILTIMELENE